MRHTVDLSGSKPLEKKEGTDSNKLKFPEGYFKKPRREATEEPLADISEPMQVSKEVLRGEKKLRLLISDKNRN